MSPIYLSQEHRRIIVDIIPLFLVLYCIFQNMFLIGIFIVFDGSLSDEVPSF